jgi:hypothetical protein
MSQLVKCPNCCREMPVEVVVKSRVIDGILKTIFKVKIKDK